MMHHNVFSRSFLSLILMLILFSCKKDRPISDKHQEEIEQKQIEAKRQDSIRQDSIAKAEQIKYDAFIFPKGKKDSAMAVFLEKYSKEERFVILALNRLDDKNKWRADTMVIPTKIDSTRMLYSPFPKALTFLKPVDKLAFFHYGIHAYALYENGSLVKWGPTSMGKKETPTKKGLTYTNWKKELAISTVNSSWKLRWNFNVYNYLGIGWHQYDLPGFHASHSCMRLLEEDAAWLYHWAEQWILNNDGTVVLAKGTPVYIFGETDFNSKPWLRLLNDKNANNLTLKDLETELTPYLDSIVKEQSNSKKLREKIQEEKSSSSSFSS